ncbi:MAG: hypothetical protein K0S39_5235 [Paenibacillus sp.]|jgi:hypothetical protein|nr:hypothetical protein [Paenibacillus sp.]
MLTYRNNPDMIKLQESPNGNDIEFHIQILGDQPYLDGMKQVQKTFEDNRVHTDVLFYAYAGHVYKVIVRRDYYEDFILELMRHRLLQRVEWTE